MIPYATINLNHLSFWHFINNPDQSMPPFRSKVGHPFQRKPGHPFQRKPGLESALENESYNSHTDLSINPTLFFLNALNFLI